MPPKSKKIDFRYNLNLYFRFLSRYKALFFGLLLAVLLIEAATLADKFLFKIIIDRGGEWAAGSLLKEQFSQILLVLAAVFLGVSLIKSLLKWLHLHLINRLDGRLIADLKRKFFHHLLYLSYHFHTTHRTGSLISRLIRGGRAIESLTDIIIFNTAPLIFQLLIVSASLLYFGWIPAVAVLLTVVVFVGYSYYILEQQREPSLAANEADDLEKATIGDYFLNIESIKYFGKESSVVKKFRGMTERTKAAYLKYWDYYRWLDSGQFLILSLGTFLIIGFPLLDFLNGKMTLGTLAFIYTAYGGILGPMSSFVRGMRDFYQSMADLETLFQYGRLKNEVKDKPQAKEMQVKEGKIEFRNISFGYRQRKLFSDFSLLIPPNRKVALVGPSGSGKTTLVKLLYRLYDVNKGGILIDGKNIKEFQQESLRSELSVVPQECLLFDDTIYNNIAFSNPQAARKEVLRAMKFAQLDQVVKNFPKGEKTIVGERGVKLSGGEKQRVSIARAILAGRKILVLDEATSSLDSRTEQEIQQDLEKLMAGRTVLIIAHRLSTIMKADLIVVLDKGKIVQLGKHSELIKHPGLYQKLWNLQRGGYLPK